MHFHLEQLKADTALADAIVAAASTQLGQPVRIEFRSADAPAIPSAPEDSAIPEKDDLDEAPASEADDPEAIVTEMLGATLVQDTTNDS